MAVGDGTTWDETTPTDATTAVSIDDYNRDVRIGVRSRMTTEHEWPSSQSATSEGGKHKYITLQEQAVKPTIAGTQVGGVYIKTVGTSGQQLFFEDESGNEERISRQAPTYQMIATTATGAVTTATYTQMLALTTTFAVIVASQPIEVAFYGNVTVNAAIERVQIRLVNSATQLSWLRIEPGAGGGWQGPVALRYICDTLAAGTHDFAVQWLAATDGGGGSDVYCTRSNVFIVKEL